MADNVFHVVPFRDSLAHRFKELNITWLCKYFEVEPIDEEMLSDPQRFIIDKGGHILFAEMNGAVVGTCALMKSGVDQLELGKMAVAEEYQGQGIGRALLKSAIEQAQKAGAKELLLYSNSILKPAIHLYESFGFTSVPLKRSDYKRSNIKMIKQLALSSVEDRRRIDSI